MPKGSCLCGEVRVEWQSASLWSAHCHCTLCQRAHGAAFVTWVGATAADMTLSGEDSLCWYESTPGAERGFCRSCGTTLFFRSERWPGELHVTRANLEGDVDIAPGSHTFWPTHVDWFPFNDQLARGDGSG